MAEPVSIALLVLAGTWAALDGTAVGQFLIARPLVVATLAGAVLGDVGAGLLVGMLLEGVYVGDVPAGGARFPEPGPPAVGATLAFVRLGGGGGLALALALGVVLAVVAGRSVVALRHLNGRIVARRYANPEGGRSSAAPHWRCVGADALRGLVVSLLGIGLALGIPRELAQAWTLSMPATIGLLALPALVSGGALLRAWAGSGRRRLLFLAGCAGGLALAVTI
jgi:mannose/fructose/N-acetylgalactosamine-specific phosphotransferase system component IIC